MNDTNQIKNMVMESASAERFSADYSRKSEFILFLLGYFLSKVVWGVDNQGFSLNLGILQMGVVIYALFRFPPPLRWIGLATAFYCFLLIIELINALGWRSTPGNDEEYVTAAIRLWGYLFGITLFVLTIRARDVEVICDAFIRLSMYAVMVAVASTLIYFTTGAAVLMNFYGGNSDVVRPHAFFSEPSAFAPMIATLLIVGYQKRDATQLLWGVIGLLITQSPIVILTALLAILILIFSKGSGYTRALFIAAAFVLAYMAMSADCISMRESNSMLMVTAGRTVCGVQSFFDESMVSQNARLVSTLAVIEILQAYDAWWRGFGLNSSSIFMGQLYEGMQENSFWLSLILFYGVPGVVGGALFCLYSITRIRRAPIELAAIFVALMVASSINSAQGFYLYGMFIFAMIVLAIQFSGSKLAIIKNN